MCQNGYLNPTLLVLSIVSVGSKEKESLAERDVMMSNRRCSKCSR